MRTSQPLNRRGFIVFLLADLLLFVAIFVAQRSVLPDFERITSSFERGAPVPIDFPYAVTGDQSSGLYEVTALLNLTPIFPTQFELSCDDCLHAISINGATVLNLPLPHCKYDSRLKLDLAPYLQKGRNEFRVYFRNNGGDGGLSIAVSRTEPLRGAVYAVLIYLAVLPFIVWLRNQHRNRAGYAVGLIYIGSIVLNAAYFLATPLHARAYDSKGHLEYLNYILANWRIPSLKEGFEFYHPPLYYALAAAWVKSVSYFEPSAYSQLIYVQFFSLCMTVAAIGLGMLALKQSRLLGPWGLVLCTAILGTLPGIIFTSSRVSNDVLVQLLSFVVLLLLVRWWQTNQDRHWYAVAVTIAFGILTKSTILNLIPVAYALLLFHRSRSVKRKIVLGAGFAAIVLVLAGWLPAWRMLYDHQTTIIGNNSTINEALRVPVSFGALATFNPFKFVQIPYNDPWAQNSRRGYLWEYFLRSMFVGEFDFGNVYKPLVHTILTLFALILPFGVFGLYRSLRHRFMASMPLWMTLGGVAASMVYARCSYPFASTEDFRYCTVAAVPLLGFILHGIESSNRYVAWPAILCATLLALACAGFVASIYVFTPVQW